MDQVQDGEDPPEGAQRLGHRRGEVAGGRCGKKPLLPLPAVLTYPSTTGSTWAHYASYGSCAGTQAIEDAAARRKLASIIDEVNAGVEAAIAANKNFASETIDEAIASLKGAKNSQ